LTAARSLFPSFFFVPIAGVPRRLEPGKNLFVWSFIFSEMVQLKRSPVRWSRSARSKV
jgi:hydroxypyruvate isomerase